jgi:hypothetical protein
VGTIAAERTRPGPSTRPGANRPCARLPVSGIGIPNRDQAGEISVQDQGRTTNDRRQTAPYIGGPSSVLCSWRGVATDDKRQIRDLSSVVCCRRDPWPRVPHGTRHSASDAARRGDVRSAWRRVLRPLGPPYEPGLAAGETHQASRSPGTRHTAPGSGWPRIDQQQLVDHEGDRPRIVPQETPNMVTPHR